MDSPKRSLYKILFDSASSLSDPKTAFCERDPIKSSVADDVKDVSLFLKTVSNGQDTHRDMWRLCTKAKDTLGTNGARVENIMWRLMALSLKERKEKEARELEKEQKEKQKPVDTIKSELMEEDEYEAEESLEEEEEEEFVEAVKMEEDSERVRNNLINLRSSSPSNQTFSKIRTIPMTAISFLKPNLVLHRLNPSHRVGSVLIIAL